MIVKGDDSVSSAIRPARPDLTEIIMAMNADEVDEGVTDTTGAIDTRPAALVPRKDAAPEVSLPPARTPLSTPPVAVVGVLVALALLAAAAACARDALVQTGGLDGTSWSGRLAEGVDGLGPRSWMVPAGVAAVAVGLLLVVLALLPRRRTHLPLQASSSVYLRPRDVDLLAVSAAEAVPAVRTAQASASRRRVRVVVGTDDRDVTAVRADVVRVVHERLAALERTPKVTVKARATGGVR